METVLIDGVARLADYKLLGIFLVIVLASLFLAVRYMFRMNEKRDAELNARETACEARVERISTRLDHYIDNDRTIMFKAMHDQTMAYKDFSMALKSLSKKLGDDK